jgi:hypothetical protein
VTPVAWLLALRVGVVCVAQSTSALAARRLQEAALAGAWFGLLQGVLYGVMAPRMGAVLPSEQASATLLTVLIVVVGIGVGAGLSTFTAYLVERRRRADP